MIKRRRSPRGAVLIFVLALLLLLTIAAVAYVQMSGSSRSTSNAVKAQQIAAARADEAAQRAIADIRSGTLVLEALSPRSPPSTPADCALNCVVESGFVDGGSGELEQGGGMQWDYTIYRNMQVGTPANRYTVLATGYYGYTAASPTFAQARVEVEVDIGTAGGGDVGTDDSSGMMRR